MRERNETTVHRKRLKENIKNFLLKNLQNTSFLITPKKHMSHERMICGRTLSKVSISFPNRLTILPLGVVSKKHKGDRKIRANISQCRCLEAAIIPRACNNDPSSVENAVHFTSTNKNYDKLHVLEKPRNTIRKNVCEWR